MVESEFFSGLDHLVATSSLVIDRPKGTPHPRFNRAIYPLDYGYLHGTSSGDGAGIDVFVGSVEPRRVAAVVLTVDAVKWDAEMKVLLGCTPAETRAVRDFLRDELGVGGQLVMRE